MRDTAGPPLRVLTLTTLYPNAALPSHGVFVETRLRHLVATGRMTARVVAPVPWVPPLLARLPRYAGLAHAPVRELREGMDVVHPRYPVLPKVGMQLAPHSLRRAFLRGFDQLGIAAHEVDLVDAHYFYPDGVAAAWVARQLGKPLVITGRGTDLNLVPHYPGPRRLIRWAAQQADGLITVCAALKEVLVQLGIPQGRVAVLRNGVDLQRFAPQDRWAARQEFGLPDLPILASVGHLIERKGHHLVIQALRDLPGLHLAIAGDGEEEARLRALADAEGVAPRVHFLGRLAQDRLPALYSAADALVLASSREGWANVLLEAMACGTPVVATALWGTPEVVTAPAAGVLVETRSAAALAAGVRRLLAIPPDRAATRAYAERFSWEATTRAQIELYQRVAARCGSGPARLAKAG